MVPSCFCASVLTRAYKAAFCIYLIDSRNAERVESTGVDNDSGGEERGGTGVLKLKRTDQIQHGIDVVPTAHYSAVCSIKNRKRKNAKSKKVEISKIAKTKIAESRFAKFAISN